MHAVLALFTTALQHTAQFTVDLNFVLNKLPLWFLVFALFLPRIAMLVAWFQGVLVPFHLQGLVPALFWLLLPRLLVLYLIYVDQGIHLWFILHLVAALVVWGGSGGYHSRRRRRDDY
ncbi:MAG: hypothetical protein M3Y50_02680 [Acidobacteriota bacterium]|nr:hypothetical protein [Acidobacteriota bacterium]